MRTPSVGKPARKASSVRHTRAIQRDRRRHPPSAPPAVEITVRLTELVYPAALNTLGEFRCRGLRQPRPDAAGDGGTRTCPHLAPTQRCGRARAPGATGAGVLGSAPSGLGPSPGEPLALLAWPCCSARSAIGCCPSSMPCGRAACGPCRRSSPGRAPTSAGSWSVMAPRWMPWIAQGGIVAGTAVSPTGRTHDGLA